MKLWLGLLLFWPVWVTAAETVVVKDQLPINVRDGPGTSFGIVAAVKSGQRLVVLEQKPGYFKVRTPKGNEGWVLARFVQSGPVAQEQLDAALAARDAALDQQQASAQEVAALQLENADLVKRLQASQAGENEAASDALCESAPEEVEQVKEQATPLVAADILDNGCAESEQATPAMRSNMLLGAGILLAGILLGFIFPLIRRRKRPVV